MAYLGRQPVTGAYLKLDDISSAFNGAQTVFSLTSSAVPVTPGTARNLILSLGGVIQEPEVAYTIIGSTLTFTGAPAASQAFFGVVLGTAVDVGTISAGLNIAAANLSVSGNTTLTGNTAAGNTSITGTLTVNGNTAQIIQLSTLTGQQNDFALANGVAVLRINNASPLTITGFSAGFDGQRVQIISIGAGQIDLAHQNTASSTSNRLINYATSNNTSLAAGSGTAEIIYDAASTRWRLTRHEQGAPIAVAYSAGNFTATAGTWVVDVGDLQVYSYYLKGKLLTVHITAITTSVSSAAVVLIAQCPGGYQSAFSGFFPSVNRATDNTAFSVGMAGITVNSSNLAFWVAATGAGYGVSANNSTVDAIFSFEVK